MGILQSKYGTCGSLYLWHMKV